MASLLPPAPAPCRASSSVSGAGLPAARGGTRVDADASCSSCEGAQWLGQRGPAPASLRAFRKRPLLQKANFLNQRRSSPHVERRRLRLRAESGDGKEPTKYSTEFGYSRKDVILIGVGLIAVGYALYYGLQAAGVDPLIAGNAVQLFVFLGICLGYISTYLFRVARKDMTYVKQLEDYEEAVLAKRLEELPETERERLQAEIDELRASRRKASS